MAGCNSCSRGILFVLNVLDFLFGASCVILGLIMLVKYKGFPWFLWFGCFFVGGLLLLTVFLSECGKSCMRNLETNGQSMGQQKVGCTCLLKASNYLGGFIMLLQLAVAIAVLVDADAVQNALESAADSPDSLDGRGWFCCGSTGCSSKDKSCGQSASSNFTVPHAAELRFPKSGRHDQFDLWYTMHTDTQPKKDDWFSFNYTYSLKADISVSHPGRYNNYWQRLSTPDSGCQPAASALNYDDDLHQVRASFDCTVTQGNTTQKFSETITMGLEAGSDPKKWSKYQEGSEKVIDAYHNWHKIIAYVFFGLAGLQLMRLLMSKCVAPNTVEDEQTERLNASFDAQYYQRRVNSQRERSRYINERETAGMSREGLEGFEGGDEVNIDQRSCAVQ
jgi:hypothetical protein